MRRRYRVTRNNFVFPSAFDLLCWRTGTNNRRAARLLCRTERTIADWRAGNRPVPRWAFDLVYYAAFELPELRLEKLRYRGWADLRPFYGAPANADPFLPAQGLSQAATGAPDHAVPNPAQPGRTVGPSGAHGRARRPRESRP